ncbi:M20/M25/M40 family metallo-hydrolase [Pinibacter soli]|uniref:M20/M25/M40 family metallo-hydrolase n=1 Tax=Pinibacter soli TaxID=3044211 RepID=A0ABT6R8U7_9BACT|nr:M20/M25/M40 family metallo-hydrolase [Pinibacter soli]MDI3318986.1 M20/M25/M40 family metallo-hydrolase [Pinibacter soli]
MRSPLWVLMLPAVLSFPGSFAQKIKKNDKPVVDNLQKHVRFLSNDDLEGRLSGSKGEKLADDYVSEQFKLIGLQAKGDNNSWLQNFEIYDGKEYSSSTLTFDGETINSNSFFPFPISPEKSVKEEASIALREKGVPWFLDLKEILTTSANDPHFDVWGFVEKISKDYAKKGATALFVYNTSTYDDGLSFEPKAKGTTLPIPVVYVNKNVSGKYFADESATIDIDLKVAFVDNKRTAHNVIGYADNGAKQTIIIGAHLDHLGRGEDGNTLGSSSNTNEIYNGADDNASGIAAVIELARMLKAAKFKNNNYLFIAFSGEELGLLGSKYFTEHPTVDLSSINYMINLDMVGRLNDSNKALMIGGYGTSPSWSKYLTSANDSKYFTVKYDSSGAGPSDHTSFYRKDIPVLFFFTGLHSDYHKPSDDFDKINYDGEFFIVKYIYNVIGATNKDAKLTFTKTTESQTSTSARFSVTLGIVPDYSFNGDGVRVDGVHDGRPAQKAGLQPGDVITKLGADSVLSLENYMQALGKYKKGDKAPLKYKRGDKEISTEVTF